MENYSNETRLTLLVKLSKCDGGQQESTTGRQAWDEFVEIYSPMVVRWCRNFGLDDDACQDATQELMLKLLKKLKEFKYDRSRGSFRSWLKTVTSNLVRDIIRNSKADNIGSGDTGIIRLLAQVEDPKSLSGLSEIFEQQYEREVMAIASEQVRKRVSSKNWDAWQRYAIDQQKARIVADELEIPIAEVYVAKSRIAKMMREEIAKIERALDERAVEPN